VPKVRSFLTTSIKKAFLSGFSLPDFSLMLLAAGGMTKGYFCWLLAKYGQSV
jgi:hypothetical protein